MNSLPPTSLPPPSEAAHSQPDGASRYEVAEQIGRGGMATVHRARDRATGQQVALKRLTGKNGKRPSPAAVELFEREYNTLNQLAHPRVVQAFDYGIDGGTPFYTMELLDGGDLHSRAPMPWQQVCMVAYEVCSVLTLLHSRQLVHRDLTPRNIRLTDDGRAKLIDFGLLCPMGPVQVTAGTPPYMAPEVVNHLSLDGRSDLFSLGCTLYFALTHRTAFPARNLMELPGMWRRMPPRVSVITPDVPQPLEQLITELMRLDTYSRPRSAAEVMVRLSRLLPQQPDETIHAARAHLNAPALVSREPLQLRMRKQMLRTRRGRGGGFLLAGAPGTGRSRMLDVFVLEAKLLGCITARAGAADATAGPFGVARQLATQLHQNAGTLSLEAMARHPEVMSRLFGTPDGSDPETAELTFLPGAELARPQAQAAELPRAQVQADLRTWILAIAERRAVALAVDDLERVDEPSAALLASLSLEAGSVRLSYAATVDGAALESPGPALAILAEQARPASLEPLSNDATARLLESVFGDVPNLHATSQSLYSLSRGRPRECMRLAQHLVDQGIITYESGAWRLPEHVDPGVLPANIETALDAQVRALSPACLEVAQLLALSVLGHLSRTDLLTLTGVPGHALEDVMDVLRRAHLASGGTRGYALVNRAAEGLLVQLGSEDSRQQLHDRLASLYAGQGATAMVTAHHRLKGATPQTGVDLLVEHLDTDDGGMDMIHAGSTAIGRDPAARTLVLADEVAARLGRSDRERLLFWHGLASTVARGADIEFHRAIPASWLAILKRDSGFLDWHGLEHIEDPYARVVQAVTLAAERYERTPEAERVLSPQEAIRGLVRYVSIGFTIANRTRNLVLSQELTGLLTPFAPLRPTVEMVHRNARTAYLTAIGAYDASRALLTDLVEQLETANFAPAIRYATRLHLRSISVNDGLEGNASQDIDWIDGAEYRVFAEGINTAAALHRGDWPAADGHRRRGERIALEHGTGGAFALHTAELFSRAMANDLTGVRAVRDGIEPRARSYDGWKPEFWLAEAHLHTLTGEYDRTLEVVDALRAHQHDKDPKSPCLFSAISVEARALVELGRPDEARARALEAHEQAAREDRSAARRLLSMALVMADTAVGHYDGARARILELIAEQGKLGVSGLLRGLSHEYLARVEMAAGRAEAFEQAAEIAAEAYRVDQNSMFAGRYRRLIEDAHKVGLGGRSLPTDAGDASSAGLTSSVLTQLTQLTNLAEEGNTEELPREVLSLLCPGEEQDGWLFLLTDSGLQQMAGTCVPEDDTALKAFAQLRLELELDDGDLTRTYTELPANQPVADDEGSDDALTGPDGRRAIALSAVHEGRLQVVGVAVLNGTNAPNDPPGELVHGLAKHLIESGIYRPREAG